jgi:hypothetical protein
MSQLIDAKAQHAKRTETERLFRERTERRERERQAEIARQDKLARVHSKQEMG